MSESTHDRVRKEVQRLHIHLPEEGETELVILKGHLLLEELLRKYIDKHVKNPEALKDAKFEFHHCLAIARALAGDEIRGAIWAAIKQVNSIRNDLAHQLEPRKLEDKIQSLKSHMRAAEAKKKEFDEDSKSLGELRYVFIILYIDLAVTLHMD
jgi:hypothetical protein